MGGLSYLVAAQGAIEPNWRRSLLSASWGSVCGRTGVQSQAPAPRRTKLWLCRARAAARKFKERAHAERGSKRYVESLKQLPAHKAFTRDQHDESGGRPNKTTGEPEPDPTDTMPQSLDEAVREDTFRFET